MLFKYSYLDWLLGRVHFALTLPSSSVTVTSLSGTVIHVGEATGSAPRATCHCKVKSITGNIEFFSGQF